jgi:hypothetical protein
MFLKPEHFKDIMLEPRCGTPVICDLETYRTVSGFALFRKLASAVALYQYSPVKQSFSRKCFVCMEASPWQSPPHKIG